MCPVECNTDKKPCEGRQKGGDIFVLSEYELDYLCYLFQQYQTVSLS